MTSITEGLPVIQPTPEPIIITRHCANGGWIAALAKDPGKWMWGPSEAEAVFFLMQEYPEIFGIIQRVEE